MSRLELAEPPPVTWTDERSSVLPVLRGRLTVKMRELTAPGP